jgi:hypothetical protein
METLSAAEDTSSRVSSGMMRAPVERLEGGEIGGDGILSARV